MATDPEARSSGNSAILIAVIALILVAGIGFMLMNRGTDAPDTIVNNPAPSTTVVENKTTEVVPVPVPGNTTVVTPPAASSSDKVETKTETKVDVKTE